MHPVDPISIHIHQGYCYFEPFQETDQEARLPLYRSNWWGKIWAWLGFAVKFQTAGNDKVYYVDKKNLNAWIKKYEGTTKTTGNYQERIAQIIETFREQQREDNLTEIMHHISSEQLKNNADVHGKDSADVLESPINPEKIIRQQQEQEDTAICLKEDKYIFYFGNEKIIARPDRMETSHYFKHFLLNKDRRVIDLELDLFAGMLTKVKKPTYSPKPQVRETDGITYTVDPFIYEVQEIEIDPEAFEILKLYLEGKPDSDLSIDTDLFIDASSDLEPDSASNDDKLLDGEAEIAPFLTIPVLESLYTIHQMIDISGILEIAHRHIDFYSQEKMQWEGRLVSRQEFWTAFASKCQDEKFKAFCKEKYRSANLIESFFKESLVINPLEAVQNANNLTRFDNSSNSSCLFENQMNLDGTNTIVLKFKFDYNYQHVDYYKHKLKYLSDFIDSHFEEANISKIVVDISAIKQSVFKQLIDSITQDLVIKQHKKQLELVFQNGDCFKKVEAQQGFQSTLLKLLENYKSVSFQHFLEIYNYFPCVLRSFFPFDIPSVQSKSHFDFTYESFRSFSNTFFYYSVDFQESLLNQQDISIQYIPGYTNLGNFDFSYLDSSTNLTLEAAGTKRPWKEMHLYQLPFQKLIFKNIVVNPLFLRELKEIKTLTHFDLQDCKIMPNCQAEVKTLLALQNNQTSEAFDRLDTVIKTCGSFLPDLWTTESCIIKAHKDIEGTHLNLKFGLTSATNIDKSPYYQMGQAPSHYHQKQLSFISKNLTPEQLDEANIKSVIIDFDEIIEKMERNSDLIYRYMGQLLDHVHHHFNIGNKENVRFVIKDFPVQALLHYDLEKVDLLMLVLKEMLKKHSIILNIYESFKSTTLLNLFEFLKEDQHRLVMSHHLTSNFFNSLSLSFKPSDSLEPELEFLFDQNNFDLSVLSTIQDPTHLILEQTNGNFWNASHLSQLSVQNLTIKNAVSYENFITKFYDEEGNDPQFPHLKKLTLKDCKIEPEIKELIINYFLELSDQRTDDSAFCEVNFVDQE